jgi:DNA-binding NarL/FixJ family response regulator
MPIRLLTVDDHAVVRTGITAILADEPGIEVVAEAGDGERALAVYNELRPDVVLMDLRMPVMDGIAATRAIRAADARARILALTVYEGDGDMHRALSAGACGYVIKDAPSHELIAAVRAAAAGRRVLAPRVAQALAEHTPRVDLTAREVEVLRLVARGFRNEEVASLIGRTPATVKAHLKHITDKLGVDGRTQAVTLALQRGIIHVDQ